MRKLMSQTLFKTLLLTSAVIALCIELKYFHLTRNGHLKGLVTHTANNILHFTLVSMVTGEYYFPYTDRKL